MAKPATYRIAKYELSYVKEGSFSISSVGLTSKEDVSGIAKSLIGEQPFESVIVFVLDNKLRPIGMIRLDGEVNYCTVSPASVFRFLLSSGAASFVLAHNHPGGSLEFSSADIEVAKRLHQAGRIFNISFLDSVIVTENGCASIRDIGVL